MFVKKCKAVPKINLFIKWMNSPSLCIAQYRSVVDTLKFYASDHTDHTYSVSNGLREGTFFIEGEGGGPGPRRGGSLVNFFLQIGEDQTRVIPNRWRVTIFFGKEKITLCRLVDSYLLTNTRSV